MQAPIYDTNPIYTSILTLEEELFARGIEYTMTRIYDGWQIRIYSNGIELDDCIQHNWSHGAHLDLLETYRLNECNGYMTVEEVLQGWKEMFPRLFCRSTC